MAKDRDGVVSERPFLGWNMDLGSRCGTETSGGVEGADQGRALGFGLPGAAFEIFGASAERPAKPSTRTSRMRFR